MLKPITTKFELSKFSVNRIGLCREEECGVQMVTMVDIHVSRSEARDGYRILSGKLLGTDSPGSLYT